MLAIHSGTGGLALVIFRPVTVAVRDSHDPPGPAKVSGRSYAASVIAWPNVIKVYPRCRNRATVSRSVNGVQLVAVNE